MATTANSKLQITELDFADIKSNFIDFLRSQNTFKDYNYAGSAMSTLMDLLSYNTQYNAYYLNMVANEMFLDSALQRSSVISHAKLLNYTPHSRLSSKATVNVVVTGVPVGVTTLTLPRYTKFTSEPINEISYSFVNTDLITTDVVGGTATFNNTTLTQGVVSTFTFNYDQSSNPKSIFELPNENIDTSTIRVQVYPSPSETEYDVYTEVSDYLSLTNTSLVYFLSEKPNGYYEISFGDDILGKKLTDGCLVVVNYLSSNGPESIGANNFAISSPVNNYTTYINSKIAAAGGKERETIDSIKYTAPKTFFSNNRAVTKEDYISILQQNKLGISFDAVNVWGGEENIPPVYGQIFISLKPTGAYTITDNQKQKLLTEVIQPISLMTVQPTIVTPDYTYLQLFINVIYDSTKTNLSASQIDSLVKTTVTTFGNETLNTFNSTFDASGLITQIKQADASIITAEVSLKLQKKFFPDLINPKTYKLYYGAPLEKGMFQSGISNSPSITYKNPSNVALTIGGVNIEEIPSPYGGIESINVINPGFGYQSVPTVTITGDGAGATAVASLNTDGSIKSITIVTPGSGYTGAVVTITPVDDDTTGALGAAIANVEGATGNLRLFYYNEKGVKTIISNIGTVNYAQGLIQLDSFNPVQVNNDLAQLTITANPTTTIVESSFNRIITIDPFDPNAIVVSVRSKK